MAEFYIHQAAAGGDLDRVRQFIEGGVSVDSRDDRGRTPLHRAAERDRYEVVEYLIAIPECDLNLRDRDGLTPVLLAADRGRKSVVDFLLQRGVQVNCADDEGWSLLHHVAGKGWTDTVQSILDRGEDLNAAEAFLGKTPLIHAAEEGHEEVAALLIRAGADVNRSDAEKETALHYAAAYDHPQVVQVLLEVEGLDLNPQNEAGRTPLHEACKWGCREVIKQLLVAGADTTLKNNKGETALSEGFCSLWELSHEDIRLLVEHGAFLQKCDYVHISLNADLKENVLKDVDICTQSIVNKYHRHSLPALKGKFAGRLPSIDKFNLLPEHMRDVENFVKGDIQANTFCNVVQARPIVLRVMCVESLLAACQSAMKRSAASDSDKGKSV